MTRSLQSVADKQIIIGRVGAPHGIHGEVRIIPLTDFIDRFKDMEEVSVGGEVLRIQSVRYHKDVILMKFEGYPEREQARLLTNRMLTVPRDKAAPLHDGEYYSFDIIGLAVLALDGSRVGTVENIYHTGSNDIYMLHDAEQREIMIPALKSVVKEIDLDSKVMVVDMQGVCYSED